MAFEESKNEGKQPYKYNGKEFDDSHGLNLYDYSARYMEPALGRFTSVDPHAESYHSWSPYAYVGNNPLKYIDPTGMDWWVNNLTGNTIYFRNIDNLTNELADRYGLGNIDNYERLGADNMFGDVVKWESENLGSGNILDYEYVAFNNDSESFMKSHGYAKAENVKLEEWRVTQKFPSANPYDNKADMSPTYPQKGELGSKTTYVRPEKLNTVVGSATPSSEGSNPLVKIETYTYNYIKPFGADNGPNIYMISAPRRFMNGAIEGMKSLKNYVGNEYLKHKYPGLTR